MRTSRIKNIIILLLLIVNAFLLALVGVRAWCTEQGERETRERMVQVLERSNIQYLPAQVPCGLDLSPVHVTLSAGEAEARALVGDIREIRTVGARTTYVGERGSVSFSASGEIEAQFNDVPHAENYDAQAVPASGQALLREAGVETWVIEGSMDEDGAGFARYGQLWNGVRAPSWELTLRWDTDGAALTGRFLKGEGESSPAGETVTAATALTRFLKALNDGGYVCSQVRDLYAGYAVSGAGAGTVTLTPAWFVETDAWPWRFAVDGTTGTVTAGE